MENQTTISESKQEVPTEQPKQEVSTEQPKQEVPTEQPKQEVPTEQPKQEVPKEQPVARTSINTHDYDGKLLERVKLIKEKFGIEVNFEQSINEIAKYCEDIKYPRKVEVFVSLRLFIHEKNSNFDNTNQVSVEDILPRVWTMVRKWDPDGKEVFLEQLADIISGGSCAQGRTTRILQLFPI